MVSEIEWSDSIKIGWRNKEVVNDPVQFDGNHWEPFHDLFVSLSLSLLSELERKREGRWKRKRVVKREREKQCESKRWRLTAIKVNRSIRTYLLSFMATISLTCPEITPSISLSFSLSLLFSFFLLPSHFFYPWLPSGVPHPLPPSFPINWILGTRAECVF